MLDHTDHVVNHVDDYLHDALDAADAGYVERHCDGCRICKLALDEARKRFAVLQALPPIEPSEQLIQATLRRIDSHHGRILRVRRWFVVGSLSGIAAAVLLIGALNIYYLNLTPTPYDLRILGQSRLLAGSVASLRIRLIDKPTGKPIEGVPVDVELRSADQTVKLASFTTNAEGTGEPRFNLPDWADGDYTLHVVAHPNRDTEEITQLVQLRREWKVMLSSDKPVYQPGQRIRVRSLALRRHDLKPVAGERVVIAIRDPKGNVIFKQGDVASRFGISSAECPLDSEILEGRYDVECKVGDTESKLSVEVKKYVLPKFKIELTLDQPYYQPGQKVKGVVQADYFFGKPVAGGTADLEIATMEANKRTLAKLPLKTDKEGKSEFEIVLPQSLVGREQDGGDSRVSFQVSVTDSAGQKQERTVSRVVTANPLHIEVIPENGSLVWNESNRVFLFVSYADGQPAKVRVVVSGIDRELTTNALGVAMFELKPTDTQVGVTIRAMDDEGREGRRNVQLSCGMRSLDFILRANKAVYSGGDTMMLTALGGGREPLFVDLIKDGQTILTETLDVDTAGKATKQIDLPPELSGTIELCAYRYEGDGLPVRKTRVLYVRPAKQLDIQAALDRKEYRPGGKATLRLTLTDAQGQPTPGALSLAAVDEAVFSVLEQMPGMERTFYLLEQELLKPVYAIYPWAPDLKTSIQPEERNQFEQALFARTTQTRSPMTTRRERIAGDVSEQTVVEPDTFHTLAAQSYPSKMHRLAESRKSGLSTTQMLWLVLGVSCALMAYAGLWLFLSRATVFYLHVGLGVFVAVSAICLVPLIAIRQLSSSSPGMALEGMQMATADGRVPIALKGAEMDFARPDGMVSTPCDGDEPVGHGLPVRVRELFPETLLWRPELITDDSGRASLDIDLADSITTWRLTASAVTADGRLGAVQTSIRVFQPFFVDLNLPVALTRGDEVAIPVVVYNYLAKAQAMELKLDDAGWFERQTDATQRLELAANEIRSTSFRIRVRTVGEQTLQVTATGSGVADAIKRGIEVVPDGRRIEQVTNGTLNAEQRITLNVPPEAIEGSAKAFLKLYPSTFSQLVEGLDGIFRMPSGCFEQTSSTTYPNVLALDYLKRTKTSAPEIDAKARQIIHLGYQRLIGFEIAGGGFDWFGRPPANVTLTAYGLMEFQDMARVHDVDAAVIERTRRWLLSKRNSDGSWSPESHGLHEDPTRRGDMARLSTSAYVAWAVYGGFPFDGTSLVTSDYLLSFRPERIDDPYVLALVCNALLALHGNPQAAEPYLRRLDGMHTQLESGRKAYWAPQNDARTTFYGRGMSGNIETTALAALAFMTAREYPATTRAALDWLVSMKDGNGTWHSTQATVLALKALVAATDSPLGGDQERRFELTLGNQVKRELVIPANQADVMKQIDLSPFLTPGHQELTLTERTQTGATFQVTFRYHVPSAKPEKAEPLTIDLAYDREALEVGGTVGATATVVNKMATAAPMVMLDLPIPGGFAPVRDDFDALVKAGTIAKYQVTARQVVVYLRGLEPGKPLKLTYHLKATMPVKVSVPAARVYEYYDPQKQGHSATAKLSAK
jgi:hypothetical protein